MRSTQSGRPAAADLVGDGRTGGQTAKSCRNLVVVLQDRGGLRPRARVAERGRRLGGVGTASGCRAIPRTESGRRAR